MTETETPTETAGTAETPPGRRRQPAGLLRRAWNHAAHACSILIGRLMPRSFRAQLTVAISIVFLVAIGSATAVQTAIVNGMFAHAMTITTNHPVSGGITMESNGVVEGDTPADFGTGSGENRNRDTQSGAGKTPDGAAKADNEASSGDEAVSGSSATPPTGSATPSQTVGSTSQTDGNYRVDWGKDGSFTITTPYGISIWNQDTVANGLRISAAVIFALFGAASVIVIWLVTSRMSRQLKSISDQAAALDPGKLDTRIDVGGGGLAVASRSTEVTQLGNAINGMLERIQTAAEAERRFVSNASHELRTPIAAVETNLDAPLAQGRFPADVEPSVRRALVANRRGARLVQALLTLSRIQSGALAVAGRKRSDAGVSGPGGAVASGKSGASGKVGSGAAGSTSGMAGASSEPSAILADCVTRAIADVTDDAEAHDITIHADDLPDVLIAANPTLLDLAVGNLVRNAVMHNVDGGSVDVEIQQSDRLITLTVTNTTDETLPDDLNELTQPFHRGEHSRISAVPGVGLGLSIVAAACDALAARLALSRPSPATFRAALSVDEPAAAKGLARR